jgi:hypothetical protein
MKKLSKLLFFLCISTACFSQETKFKEYSYTQLFQMIAEEEDTAFELSNSLIRINLQTDSLFMLDNDKPLRQTPLVINKEILLDGVHFENPIFRSVKDNLSIGYLANIHFKKAVTIRNTAAIHIKDCEFDDYMSIGGSGFMCAEVNVVEEKYGLKDMIEIENSKFKNGFKFFFNCNYQDDILKTSVFISGNEIWLNKDNNSTENESQITGHQFGSINLMNNKISGDGWFGINHSGNRFFLVNNEFTDLALTLSFYNFQPDYNLGVFSNRFTNIPLLSFPLLKWSDNIELRQFDQGFEFGSAFEFLDEMKETRWSIGGHARDSLIQIFQETTLIEKEESYSSKLTEFGNLYDYFKQQHNNKSANQIYRQMKDLETSRLAYEFSEQPNFDTFFTWKINQFLKVFSAYGTRPSKAIVFSLYVILAFALIYLLFPNSWDAHGKNRIVDRYRFFFKYLQRNAGIHEVYLEEKRQDLLGYEEFKSIITNSEKSVPRFFSVTALPLYQWAVSGTQISANILSKVDILKGTWEDLPAGQKAWKSFLLVGGFLIALVYDLLIKVLNALMLSINTFTTLGFGEIPIKGLPRYLAIIQGFIGWFMLTIFSVSLISQILN